MIGLETFLAVLLLLGLIAVSNIVNRFIPFVPVPLIQIGLGIIAALIPTGIHMHFEPELFFVLFIAPLLFNDGRRTPAMSCGICGRRFCCWRLGSYSSPSLSQAMRSTG